MSAYHVKLLVEDIRTFIQLISTPDNAVHQQRIRHNDHLHDRCSLDTCHDRLCSHASTSCTGRVYITIRRT